MNTLFHKEGKSILSVSYPNLSFSPSFVSLSLILLAEIEIVDLESKRIYSFPI